MEKIIKIDGMKCNNCKNHIIKALKELNISKVKVDLKKGIAIIKSDNEISNDKIIKAIEDIGYKVIQIN